MTKFAVLAVVLGLASGCKKAPTGNAEVECKGGFLRSSCSVVHTKGDATLEVAWKLAFLCRGRHPAIAHGRVDRLKPGEAQSRSFSRQDFTAADGCEITGSEIRDLEVYETR